MLMRIHGKYEHQSTVEGRHLILCNLHILAMPYLQCLRAHIYRRNLFVHLYIYNMNI
jgi:hypothetical protein